MFAPAHTSSPPPGHGHRPTTAGTFLFGGAYAMMLVAGFAIGFRAGSAKPTSPARNPVVVVAKTKPSLDDPEPRGKAPVPKAPEPKAAEPTKVEPKPEPPPEKKPEPMPEPKSESKVEPKKMLPPSAPGPAVAFAQVAPVFKDKCTTCHGGVEPKGGLDLRSAKAAITGGDSGAGIKPGDADNSLIWQSISDGTMPPKGKPQLTAAEKQLIKDWIAGGAK